MSSAIVNAFGHRNIAAKHCNTIEFTKDFEIGRKADCICGVSAQFDVKKLEFLKAKVKVEITIKAGAISEKIIAYGSPELSFRNPNGIIIRKSNAINSKTIAIYADKSAKDLSRELAEKLKDPEQEILVEIKKIGEYDKLDFYEGLKLIN